MTWVTGKRNSLTRKNWAAVRILVYVGLWIMSDSCALSCPGLHRRMFGILATRPNKEDSANLFTPVAIYTAFLYRHFREITYPHGVAYT
jgi:hypothetical protein